MAEGSWPRPRPRAKDPRPPLPAGFRVPRRLAPSTSVLCRVAKSADNPAQIRMLQTGLTELCGHSVAEPAKSGVSQARRAVHDGVQNACDCLRAQSEQTRFVLVDTDSHLPCRLHPIEIDLYGLGIFGHDLGELCRNLPDFR